MLTSANYLCNVEQESGQRLTHTAKQKFNPVNHLQIIVKNKEKNKET
jgi:hypothetical protein